MTRVLTFLTRWKWCIGAWGTVLVGLWLFLPPRPAMSVSVLGKPAMRGFADDRTLIVHSWKFNPNGSVGYPSGPIKIVDLEVGDVRQVDLPDDSLASIEVVNGPDPSEFPGNETPEWRMFTSQTSGDYLVVEMGKGPMQRRLHVWNWRTGREVLRRPISDGRLHCTVSGGRIWLRRRGSFDEPDAFEVWDISKAAPVKTRFPGAQIEMHQLAISPDGTVFVQRLDRGIKLWNLEPGEELFFDQEVVQSAFSSDSRRLATLSDWKPSASGHERIWRLYEIPAGREIHRKVEVSTSEVHRLHDPASLSFHDENRCIAGYSRSPIGRSGSIHPVGLGPVAVWIWEAGDVRLIPSGSSELQSSDYSGAFGRAPPTPRIVLDQKALIDVATGQRVATLSEHMSSRAVSPVPRWAVVGDARPQFTEQVADRFADLISPLSSDLARQFRLGHRLHLFDFQTGQPVARLPADHDTAGFSPDNQWLITLDSRSLAIWRLPLKGSLSRAFLWSLTVPLLAMAWGRRWRVRPAAAGLRWYPEPFGPLPRA